MKVSGKLVDIHKRRIYPAVISVDNGLITGIEETEAADNVFILPGLIDAHIHIESSMVTPGAFALTAVKHGTTGVVSDPHEIANVLGKDGVLFMIKDAEKVPLKFWFGAPSCVPATQFETSGAVLNHTDVGELLIRDDIKYLSEMMNFPGVVYGDEEVYLKLGLAKKLKKPVDGHAPGLKGDLLKKYVAAGISTDHECSSLDEAREKISLGMKILIREGSAARNLSALKDLFTSNPEMVMLCSDDLHPEMLQKRHLNKIIASLITDGYDIFDVIRSATINPVTHYKLEAGLLIPGERGDFILVDDLKRMNVIETWIDGKRVFGNGKVLFNYKPGDGINKFNCSPVTEKDIIVVNRPGKFKVIEAFDGELLTRQVLVSSGAGRYCDSDIKNDILKIVVKDRYNDSPPSIGFIKGFKLKKGAFASSIAHDSHNIIAIGTNDGDIVKCINEIAMLKGGLVVSQNNKCDSLQLDIAGIMTTSSSSDVAKEYEKLNALVKSAGCTMTSPFMTLSFMALLVIPELKISDRGLFDVDEFKLVSLFP